MDTAIPYTLSVPPVVSYEETLPLPLPPAIWADGNYRNQKEVTNGGQNYFQMCYKRQ